jgi:amino acid transporter
MMRGHPTPHEGGVMQDHSTPVDTDEDAQRLAKFGYKQELRRALSLFENFGLAFCYLSPVVGIYSLFVLGFGSGGPRYLWLMPIAVGGQLLVALVFAELGSHYPIAGALFQWAKNLIGAGYGWWVGWFYGWALIVTVAAVDAGVVYYAAPLINKYLNTSFDVLNPNTLLIFGFGMLAIQTLVNIVGVRFLAMISKIGVWVELAGTFGIAILLGIYGFHHGVGYLFSTQGAETAAGSPLGVDFGGHWLTGAAFVAILAHVWIFYGFESAGDVAEEVVDASRRVPRAIVRTILIGGLTSFVLVAALILAVPKGAEAFRLAGSFEGGVPFIVTSNVTNAALQDLILLLVVFAFFSCGTAVQAAAARLIFSYSRDEALPASRWLSRVSPRFNTPTNALWVAALLPAAFSLLVHFTPAEPLKILFFTWPANLNALFVLVSFGVSGIYLSFQMVVIASLVARIRGWRPDGAFRLGAYAWPVSIGALVWGIGILLYILIPTGLDSPKGALFNYDWMTLTVMLLIALIGAIYYLTSKPQDRVETHIVKGPEPAAAGVAVP